VQLGAWARLGWRIPGLRPRASGLRCPCQSRHTHYTERASITRGGMVFPYHGGVSVSALQGGGGTASRGHSGMREEARLCPLSIPRACYRWHRARREAGGSSTSVAVPVLGGDRGGILQTARYQAVKAG